MKFYKLNIKDIEFAALKEIAKKFPNRYNQAKNYVNPDDYYRSMGVYVLLNKAFTDLKEEDILFNENGKPFLKNGPYFNYSHSGDYVVLVTSEYSEVGVDIEKINPEKVQLSDKLFSKEEIDFIKTNPELNFYILWTKKESLLKAFGEGITTTSLSNIVVLGDSFYYKEKPVKQIVELIDDYIVSFTTFVDEELEY